MEITEVRIKLISAKNDKLRAFCSITIDNAFVIRDLKIIEGAKGPFVAMPSRKVMERCGHCGEKNHHRARFCNECGRTVESSRMERVPRDGGKMHADIAHPINSECREMLQKKVLDSYVEEFDRSKLPGYDPSDGADDAGAEAERVSAAESPSDGGVRFDSADSGDSGGRTLGDDGFRVEVGAGVARRDPDERSPGRRVPALDGRGPRSEVGGPIGERSLYGGAERDDRSRRRAAAESGRAREGYRSGASERFGERRPEAARRAGPPAVEARGARRPPEFSKELDTEPEDNFGAGLFS